MSVPTRRPRFLADAGDQPPATFDFGRRHEGPAALHALEGSLEKSGSLGLEAEKSKQTIELPNERKEAPTELIPIAPNPQFFENETVRASPVAPSPAPKELEPRLLAAIETLRLRSERLAEEARADALEIGFMVARKVLEHELSTGPKALFDLIRSAIRKAGESRKITLRLHPQDCAVVERASEEQRNSLTLAKIECVAAPELSPGDCMVEGDLGQVDGRLATRLAELARSIEQAVREDSA